MKGSVDVDSQPQGRVLYVTVGAPVAKPTPIFRKLDDEAVARERELTTASGE